MSQKQMSHKFLNISVFLLCGGLVIAAVSCDLKSVTQKVLYNRARNLHDHGKINEAIEIYRKVIENGEDSVNKTEVYYDLGVAYADKHDISSAQKQVVILRTLGRSDLAEVLSTVIRDSSSTRVRQRLQADYDGQK